MATKNKNLDDYLDRNIKDVSRKKFGIVVSEWNYEITEALYSGAYETLLKYGVKAQNIQRLDVPGSFELPLGCQVLAKKDKVDAVLALGCVIQGETRHFDFICDAVAHGVTNVSLKFNKPVIFGVLTTNDMAQAKARAGGKHGNKGIEAAITAIKMVSL